MTPSIRLAQPNDIHSLVDIDLKSYDYPWPLDRWREAAADPTCVIMVATIRAESVGVCAWRKRPTIKEGDILKLATKPDYRKQGVGTMLLSIVETSIADHGLHTATITVPELNCFPGHPDDVSVWLRKKGYQVVLPILRECFYMYGSRCDGFKFVHTVGA